MKPNEQSNLIRTLIVDDEPLARERIRMLLADEPDIAIVGECSTSRAAVRSIEEEQPDLLFLDVQMPVMDGFEVLQSVNSARLPLVIFVTAYDQYALRAFEVYALDYLLKPFDRERFGQAVERTRKHLQRERAGDFHQQLAALLAGVKSPSSREPAAPKYAQRFAIKSEGRITFLPAEEIDWIEASNNYVCLHAGRETHLLRETMNAVEKRLDPQKFARIHRSIIVNIREVRELQPMFRGDYLVVLRDGTPLSVGRSYRERLREVLETAC